MSGVLHLVRRFLGSLSRSEPDAVDVEWAHDALTDREWQCWSSMPVQDRRHSLLVARRFVALRDGASRAEVAGALLHDVGKQRAGLGTFARVLATLVGPRTARFRAYHDHEAVGADMLRDAGSEVTTIDLVLGRGAAAAALRAADDV
ncbi:MAG: hypothetical protein RI900_3467 [Actinomycetota bacterium]